MTTANKRPTPKKDKYTALRFDASVLYIKYGLTIKAISKKISVSERSLHLWRINGRWDELRPELGVMNEYRAAGMFINDGLSTNEISQRLSVAEVEVKRWILINGWNGARRAVVGQLESSEPIMHFCNYVLHCFPVIRPRIEAALTAYLKQPIVIVKKR